MLLWWERSSPSVFLRVKVSSPVATAQVSGVRRGSSLRSFASMSRASAIFCSAVMAVTACEALQTEE